MKSLLAEIFWIWSTHLVRMQFTRSQIIQWKIQYVAQDSRRLWIFWLETTTLRLLKSQCLVNNLEAKINCQAEISARKLSNLKLSIFDLFPFGALCVANLAARTVRTITLNWCVGHTSERRLSFIQLRKQRTTGRSAGRHALGCSVNTVGSLAGRQFSWDSQLENCVLCVTELCPEVGYILKS